MAPLRTAAAISPTLDGGGARAYAARRPGMPALRHDHHPGHAHALSVRRPASRRGHAGLRADRHPRGVQPAICRSQRAGNHSLLEGHFSEGAASAAVDRGGARTAARPSRSFRSNVPAGAAAAARALGARPIGAGTLLPGPDGTHHGACPPLRRPGLFAHLRIAWHGIASSADPARTWRLADQAACGRRGARPAVEPRAQRLACTRRDRSSGGDRHRRGAQSAGQSEDEMRNTADPGVAGCRRAHRSGVR